MCIMNPTSIDLLPVGMEESVVLTVAVGEKSLNNTASEIGHLFTINVNDSHSSEVAWTLTLGVFLATRSLSESGDLI